MMQLWSMRRRLMHLLSTGMHMQRRFLNLCSEAPKSTGNPYAEHSVAHRNPFMTDTLHNTQHMNMRNMAIRKAAMPEREVPADMQATLIMADINNGTDRMKS
jgi:hypothetical protein